MLSGALLGLAVFALVAGSPEVYETEAILSVPAPALLAELDRLTSSTDASGDRGASADERLDRADLGDVGAIAARVRDRRGLRPADSEVALRIDDLVDEAAVIVRARNAQTARRMADDIAAGIVRSRETAINSQRVSVLAESRLLSALANRDRRLRARANELRTRRAALAQLRQTPGGGITLLRPARTPSEPVAPRIARDVIVAIALGMLGWTTFASLRRTASIRRRRRVQAAA
jgi:hypothetical protein